jgi:hypothetical protein
MSTPLFYLMNRVWTAVVMLLLVALVLGCTGTVDDSQDGECDSCTLPERTCETSCSEMNGRYLKVSTAVLIAKSSEYCTGDCSGECVVTLRDNSTITIAAGSGTDDPGSGIYYCSSS